MGIGSMVLYLLLECLFSKLVVILSGKVSHSVMERESLLLPVLTADCSSVVCTNCMGTGRSTSSGIRDLEFLY